MNFAARRKLAGQGASDTIVSTTWASRAVNPVNHAINGMNRAVKPIAQLDWSRHQFNLPDPIGGAGAVGRAGVGLVVLAEVERGHAESLGSPKRKPSKIFNAKPAGVELSLRAPVLSVFW